MIERVSNAKKTFTAVAKVRSFLREQPHELKQARRVVGRIKRGDYAE
jgi:hypothetical protein